MSVYACSDLHGLGKLWDEIKDFLQPTDKLYYLGDAIDRGPDGYRILKEMLADPRVTVLLGNHEDMLMSRMRDPSYDYIAYLHENNGGRVTWEAVEADSDYMEVYYQLRNLQLYTTYTNKDGKCIFMSHSGSTDIDEEEDLLWDREGFLYHDIGANDYVVHGHTPKESLYKRIIKYTDTRPPKPTNGAYWYTLDRCCIDCGSIVTGETVLLDLDTFNEYIFN